MSNNYCRSCAIAKSLIDKDALPTGNLTGEPYQLDKFLKHTQTGYWTKGRTSLFSDPSYSNYAQYLLSAALSGYLEVDDQQRKNLILIAGKVVGSYYDPQTGMVIYPEDGVKVVINDNQAKVHGFSIANPLQSGATCDSCGCPLP